MHSREDNNSFGRQEPYEQQKRHRPDRHSPNIRNNHHNHHDSDNNEKPNNDMMNTTNNINSYEQQQHGLHRNNNNNSNGYMRKRPTSSYEMNNTNMNNNNSSSQSTLNNSKSRRLYIGNVPYHAGLTDVALTQLFSALYIAGYGELKEGLPLPVISFWLHADGKFGFMELRGEQETVNMMIFNQTVLHGRMLKVNRPSDFRIDVHAPHVVNLKPEPINALGVLSLCEKLEGIVNAPSHIMTQAIQQREEQPTSSLQQQQPTSDQKDKQIPEDDEEKDPPNSQSAMMIERRQNVDQQQQQKIEQKEKTLKTEEEKDHDQDQEIKLENNNNENNDFVVISLENLVTDEDLLSSDEEFVEIIEDVQDECNSYGEVVSVEIPKHGKAKGTAFVQFRYHQGALKAIEQLAERVFEGRKVKAVGIPNISTAQQALNLN